MFDDSQVSYEISVCQDDAPVRGSAVCSGDDDFDRGMEAEILARLADGDVWAWARVRVRASYGGADSVVGISCLGGCNYADEEDFKGGGCYEDMCDIARNDLYTALESILYRFGCVNPADHPECVD